MKARGSKQNAPARSRPTLIERLAQVRVMHEYRLVLMSRDDAPEFCSGRRAKRISSPFETAKLPSSGQSIAAQRHRVQIIRVSLMRLNWHRNPLNVLYRDSLARAA
jgi:hypothetical protein